MRALQLEVLLQARYALQLALRPPLDVVHAALLLQPSQPHVQPGRRLLDGQVEEWPNLLDRERPPLSLPGVRPGSTPLWPLLLLLEIVLVLRAPLRAVTRVSHLRGQGHHPPRAEPYRRRHCERLLRACVGVRLSVPLVRGLRARRLRHALQLPLQVPLEVVLQVAVQVIKPRQAVQELVHNRVACGEGPRRVGGVLVCWRGALHGGQEGGQQHVVVGGDDVVVVVGVVVAKGRRGEGAEKRVGDGEGGEGRARSKFGLAGGLDRGGRAGQPAAQPADGVGVFVLLVVEERGSLLLVAGGGPRGEAPAVVHVHLSGRRKDVVTTRDLVEVGAAHGRPRELVVVLRERSLSARPLRSIR
eukprot:525789-Prorocentrum_minimum.AAC.2